jgi:DNA adenine methylase
LAPHLATLIGEYLRGTYYEPFVGSGAVFLRLPPVNAVLSDSNAELIASIRTIRRFPDPILRAVRRLSNTRSCYNRMRAAQPRSSITRASRFLYLNRTCWGGIYRLNQEGKFNVPFGDSGRAICTANRLLQAAKRFRRADLRCSDFEPIVEARTMASCDTTNSCSHGMTKNDSPRRANEPQSAEQS